MTQNKISPSDSDRAFLRLLVDLSSGTILEKNQLQLESVADVLHRIMNEAKRVATTNGDQPEE